MSQNYQPQQWQPGAPVPPPAAPQAPPATGAIMTFAGGLITALAFLFLPFVSVFVGVTGPTLISALTQFDSSGWYALWLIPVIAVAIAIIGATSMSRAKPPTSGRAAAFRIAIVLAVLEVLAYLLVIVGAASAGADSGGSVISALGAGFWLGLLGMILAIVGSSMALLAFGRWRRGQWG